MWTPDRLEAIIEIQQLKARYAAYADEKYGPGYKRADISVLAEAARAQASCFTPAARWAGGGNFGGDIVGREALEAFFARPPWEFATHMYGSPIIEVDGDRAEATWRLWQMGIPKGETTPILMISRTEERYQRTSDGWLHDYVRFTHIDRITSPTKEWKTEVVIDHGR